MFTIVYDRELLPPRSFNLAIAYNVVVEKHGGRIDVRSAPGKGATFEVRLPIAEGARAHVDLAPAA